MRVVAVESDSSAFVVSEESPSLEIGARDSATLKLTGLESKESIHGQNQSGECLHIQGVFSLGTK